MTKNFREIEDVLTDESFRAWYFKENPRQVDAWEKWYAENLHYHALIEEAIEFMNSLPRESVRPGMEETEGKLLKLKKAIATRDVPVLDTPRRPVQGRWWMAAAAAILLLVGGFAAWRLLKNEPGLKSDYAEISSKSLPDGSTILLNANSHARWNENWKEGMDREIWLDGEAYFQVRKTAQASKFIVHTNGFDVIVTGTSFNVLNRSNRNSIYLTEGSVTLKTKDGREIYLHPGDYIEMNGQQAETKPAKEENVLAWKENRLSFEGTPLTEVAQIIRDHYGVDVEIGNGIKQGQSLTGEMANNNLDDLLNAISIAIDVTITRTNNTVLITGKHQ